MQVFYFSTALSDKIYDEVVSNSKRFKPTYSGVGFDRNVAVGLSEMVNITGVSLFPVPSYPKYSRIMQHTRSYEEGAFKCYVPTIASLPIIKEFFFAFNAYRFVKKNRKVSEKNVILISGLYRSLLRPASWLKKRLGLPIVAIVPDLPELMISYRKDYSGLRSYLNKIDLKRSMNFRKHVDGFVELSKYMEPFANEGLRPFVIMDGLCNLQVLDEVEAVKTDNGQYILYAGKVSKTFGVDKLVEAFIKANVEDCKLVICGDGDYAPELRQVVQNNDRISFLGVKSHKEVIALEKGATLLVEPRPSDTKIAKMSFPSKIIEYMASGTPVLVTNIPSFGDEYKAYQYRINDESVDGIANSIRETLSLSSVELQSKGAAAKEFIMENKTIQHQCEKVLKLMEEVCQ